MGEQLHLGCAQPSRRDQRRRQRQFRYDALGRRASKTVCANLTQFVYDELNPLQKTTSNFQVYAAKPSWQ